MKRKTWEDDEGRWPSDARWKRTEDGRLAWRVLGWEIQPTEDTEWDGIFERTGRVVAVMVGDDKRWVFEADEWERLDDLDYCAECGQVGCEHDGRER